MDGSQATAAIDPRGALEVSSAVAVEVANSHLQQEALILFEYEGATLEEIAQIAGVDVGTVKSRLHGRESDRDGFWQRIARWRCTWNRLKRMNCRIASKADTACH